MKRKLLIILILLTTVLSIQAAEWNYYPRKGGNQIRRMTSDKKNTIYVSGSQGTFISFDISSQQYTDSISIAQDSNSSIVDLTVDKYGIPWLMCDEDLMKYENGQTEIVDFVPDSVGKKWNYLNFSWSEDNSIIIGRNTSILNLTDDTCIIYNVHDYGSDKIFYSENILFVDNYTVFTDRSRKDSLIFIDLEYPTDKKAFPFADAGIPDTAYANKIKSLNNEVYMLVKNNPDVEYSYSKIFVCSNDKLEELYIPYLDTLYYDVSTPDIKDFTFDNNDNLVLSVVFYDETVVGDFKFDSQIIVVNRQGELIQSVKTPVLPIDYPNHHKYGQEERVKSMRNLNVMEDGTIYMLSDMSEHVGLFKLDLEANAVEDVEGGSSNLVWIFNAYPNPVADKVYLDFCCMPSYFNDLKVSLYDYTGSEYSNINFNVLNYDFNSGHGKIQVDIGQVPKGIKYLQLKSKGETYTEGIIIK